MKEKAIRQRAYKSRKDSFPAATIEFLKANGESKAEVIREAIGLNEWCSHADYADRSNYYFACIVQRLMQAGVVVKTKYAHYKLS